MSGSSASLWSLHYPVRVYFVLMTEWLWLCLTWSWSHVQRALQDLHNSRNRSLIPMYNVYSTRLKIIYLVSIFSLPVCFIVAFDFFEKFCFTSFVYLHFCILFRTSGTDCWPQTQEPTGDIDIYRLLFGCVGILNRIKRSVILQKGIICLVLSPVELTLFAKETFYGLFLVNRSGHMPPSAKLH